MVATTAHLVRTYFRPSLVSPTSILTACRPLVANTAATAPFAHRPRGRTAVSLSASTPRAAANPTPADTAMADDGCYVVDFAHN
mmetsp:Transcript_24900/g.44349  ORF Transcript_24900/g.44349 Transcript_24900/m.44349 type:complete len:84 (+) Transcript_24900:90-341(+)